MVFDCRRVVRLSLGETASFSATHRLTCIADRGYLGAGSPRSPIDDHAVAAELQIAADVTPQLSAGPLVGRNTLAGPAEGCPRTPIWYIFSVTRSNAARDTTIARTTRFPAALRDHIAADAERCGRSFEGQVLALLRRHFGEDVDIAPSPGEILALAEASFADIPEVETRALVRRLKERDR